MNQFDTPYFGAEFILEYIKDDSSRVQRVQTYVAYRFLSALIKEEPVLAKALEEHMGCELTPGCFEEIESYLILGRLSVVSAHALRPPICVIIPAGLMSFFSMREMDSRISSVLPPDVPTM